MKRFSEIKESKKVKTNDTIKNEIIDILEDLNIKVSGEETEKISNVDINIQGKEQIVEKLKFLIDDIRIQERKNTLNIVKANSYKNFNMKWLNEQIEGLEKIKIGSKFILNEKLSDTQLGDNYRAALCQYFVNNLNGQKINGWEFNFDTNVNIFDFENKELGLSMKATPFWENPDKVVIEVHSLDNQDGEPLHKKTENFNIEELLFQKYKEILEDFLNSAHEWAPNKFGL